MRRRLAVLAFACLLTATSACDRRGTTLAAATVLDKPRPVPAFSLTDQDQRLFTREQLRGQWSLVFFGFTHCPDICPNTLTLMHAARARLAQEQSLPPLRVIFVSVDPERDRPQQLRTYVRTFDPSFIGVTGAMRELQTLTNALYLPFSHTPLPSGGYSVDHSGALALINPDASAVAYFSPPHRLQDVANDLGAIMRGARVETSSPAPPAPSAKPPHHHE